MKLLVTCLCLSSGAVLQPVGRGSSGQSGGSEQHPSNDGIPLSTRGQRGYAGLYLSKHCCYQLKDEAQLSYGPKCVERLKLACGVFDRWADPQLVCVHAVGAGHILLFRSAETVKINSESLYTWFKPCSMSSADVFLSGHYHSVKIPCSRTFLDSQC